jgi:hypothetical protein
MTIWSLLRGIGSPPVAGRRRAHRASALRRPAAVLKLETLEERVVLSLSQAQFMYVASFGTDTVERYQEIRYAPKPSPGHTGATFISSGVPAENDLFHPLSMLINPFTHTMVVASLETDEVLQYNVGTGAFMGAFVSEGEGGLSGPSGMLLLDGLLYVSSTATNQILRYDAHTGAFVDVYATLTTTGGVTGIVVGPDGAIYASTRFNNSIVRITNGGSTIETFIQPGAGGLNRTGGIIFGPNGNAYVGSENTNNILLFDGQTGDFIREFVPSGSGGLRRPSGLLFGPFGDLYVDSADTNSILHYDGQTGAFINVVAFQHDNQVISGPRGFLFTETDSATFDYTGQRFLGLSAIPVPATAAPGATSGSPVLEGTAPVQVVSALAQPTDSAVAPQGVAVASGLSLDLRGLAPTSASADLGDSLQLVGVSDAELLAWNLPGVS